MKKNIKILFATFAMVLASMVLPINVFADDPVCDSETISAEVKAASGCENNATTATMESVIKNILEAIIGVAGFVAVAYVIVGGVNYMTASGDAPKITKAKNTILYALIGLIICALAFAIVNWTIDVVNNSGSSSDDDTSFYVENSIAKIAE